MKRYIIAANYEQFALWCRENAESPYDPNITYVRDHTALKGIRLEKQSQIVYYGQWWLHKDAFDIQQQVKLALLTAKEER